VFRKLHRMVHRQCIDGDAESAAVSFAPRPQEPHKAPKEAKSAADNESLRSKNHESRDGRPALLVRGIRPVDTAGTNLWDTEFQ
jgi:hypothetical protein